MIPIPGTHLWQFHICKLSIFKTSSLSAEELLLYPLRQLPHRHTRANVESWNFIYSRSFILEADIVNITKIKYW